MLLSSPLDEAFRGISTGISKLRLRKMDKRTGKGGSIPPEDLLSPGVTVIRSNQGISVLPPLDKEANYFEGALALAQNPK